MSNVGGNPWGGVAWPQLPIIVPTCLHLVYGDLSRRSDAPAVRASTAARCRLPKYGGVEGLTAVSGDDQRWFVRVPLLIFVVVLCMSSGALPAGAASPPVVPRTAPPPAAARTASPNANTILFLCPTIEAAAQCGEDADEWNEALAAQSLGFSVAFDTPTQWAAETVQTFASYRAVVIGDHDCEYFDTGPLQAAVDNPAWGAAVTGNVVIVGASPTSLYGYIPTAQTLVLDGLKLATSTPGFTGAYVALGCYYDGANANTSLDLLNKAFDPTLNRFTGEPFYADNVSVIGSNATFSDLNSSNLSCWSSSSTVGFDSYPPQFTVFATVSNVGPCVEGSKQRKANDNRYAPTAQHTGSCLECPTTLPYMLLRGPQTGAVWTPPPGWIMGDVRDADTGQVVPGATLSLTDTQIPSWFSHDGGYQFAGLSTQSGYGGSSTYGLHLSPPTGYAVVGAATQQVAVVSGHGVWTSFLVRWMPQWVQVLVPTASLWSGPDSHAVQLGSAAQWAYLRVDRPMSGTRLYVFNPATNGYAYVDRAEVGPSGAPPNH